MQNLTAKARFLKKELIPALQKISPDTTPLWGKMNLQQMIEHMAEYVAMAYGNPEIDLVIPEENVEKAQTFLKSEKNFRENTPNSLMPETPAPVKLANKTEAIADLQLELDNFFNEFDTVKKRYVMNPFFGELDYGMSIQLLHKHFIHHLKQFGVNA